MLMATGPSWSLWCRRGYEIIERMARTGVEPDDQVWHLGLHALLHGTLWGCETTCCISVSTLVAARGPSSAGLTISTHNCTCWGLQVLEAVGKRKSLRSHLRRVYTSTSAGSSDEGSTADGSGQDPDEDLH